MSGHAHYGQPAPVSGVMNGEVTAVCVNHVSGVGGHALEIGCRAGDLDCGAEVLGCGALEMGCGALERGCGASDLDCGALICCGAVNRCGALKGCGALMDCGDVVTAISSHCLYHHPFGYAVLPRQLSHRASQRVFPGL